MKETIKKELASHIYENIRNYPDCYGCDLHHHLFNEDYYIIGFHHAELWLQKHKISPWDAIRRIQEYETEIFDGVTTDLSSSENVVNMYAYIRGEELLQQSETLDAKWNEKLNIEDMNKIIEELC